MPASGTTFLLANMAIAFYNTGTIWAKADILDIYPRWISFWTILVV
jgi:hypothetical protein